MKTTAENRRAGEGKGRKNSRNMKFEGIEIALEGIWYEDNR